MTAVTNEYAAWCGRLFECCRALVQAPTPVHREVAEQRASEAVAQYQAWLDARPPVDRGFPELCGLADL